MRNSDLYSVSKVIDHHLLQCRQGSSWRGTTTGWEGSRIKVPLVLEAQRV